MIPTTDLMLGNWVEFATGIHNDKRSIPMRVTGIFADTVYLDFEGNEGDVFEEEEENLMGIPITKELLGRIMRRHYVINGCGFSDGRVIITINNGFASMQKEYTRGEINYIRYLHQLQNAYFILTGKHLKVEL